MVAAEVRALLLTELDPRAGATVIAIAELLDVPVDRRATHDDIVTLVTDTMASGAVPIGPLEYASEPIDYALDSDMPLASISVLGPDGPLLRLALALADGGWVGVGGNRFGGLPHDPDTHVPGVVLLPDLEAGLAELVVYTAQRGVQVGYGGRVEGVLDIISETPITPAVIDVESGRAVLGEPFEAFEQVRFAYTLDMPPEQVRGVIYEAATQVARQFGATEPQFLTRPESVADFA